MNQDIDTVDTIEEDIPARTRRINRQIQTFTGFINELKPLKKDDKTLYFARLGLVSGREEDGQGGYRNFIQNAELLLSASLEKWAALMLDNGGLPAGYDKLIHHFEVSALQFRPVVVEGKPYLNSRGFLESIRLGQT